MSVISSKLTNIIPKTVARKRGGFAIITDMGIQAYIYKDESGAYCADIPAFPGCHSCGDTFEEAQANIREAAALWIETANEEAA